MEQQFIYSEGSGSIPIFQDFPVVVHGIHKIQNEFQTPLSPESGSELADLPFNTTGIAPNVSKIPEVFYSPYGPLFDNLTQNLLNGIIGLICLLGLVGNGTTIYLLAFSIKRNPFTTFILNLSIADFGVITSIISLAIFLSVFTMSNKTHVLNDFYFLLLEFFFFTYSASQFLLMAISLDRCVAVLFPLWHRCHRPPYFSTVVCSLIWIVFFLLSVVHFILHQTRTYGTSPLLFYQLIVNGLLCTPLMVVSTVTLLIQLRSKMQHNQKKLLTTIFLALLFFLLFSLPMNVLYTIAYFVSYYPLLLTIVVGCSTLNSSINPLLYFLVGRKKRGKDQPRTSYKVALQRVFKDEKGSMEDQETMHESQL